MLTGLTVEQRSNINATLQAMLTLIPEDARFQGAAMLALVLDYVDALWRDALVTARDEARKDGYARGVSDAYEQGQIDARTHMEAERLLRMNEPPRAQTEREEMLAVFAPDPPSHSRH